MKTIQQLASAFLIVFCTLSVAGESLYDFKDNKLCYKINEDSISVTVTFEKYHSLYTSPSYEYISGEIVIPSQVSHQGVTYDVTSIGFDAFHLCTEITSVTIPASILSVGSSSFYGCDGITEIKVGESVTSIGPRAFSDCKNLTSITIPKSVNYIGNYAFKGCSSLKSVNISDLSCWCKIEFYENHSNPLYCGANLYLNGDMVQDLIIPDTEEAIANYAFTGCTSIKTVDIPNTVTSLGRCVFGECKTIKSVKISANITTIPVQSFYKCTSLTDVAFPEKLEIIGGNAFQNCSSLQYITIPDCVTSVVPYAFSYCTALKSVVIGKSILDIGGKVFHRCSNLELISCRANMPPQLGHSEAGNFYSAFDESHYQTCTLMVPKGTIRTYSTDDQWKKFQNVVERNFDNPEDIIPDLNGDGKVDIVDLNFIINYIIGQ